MGHDVRRKGSKSILSIVLKKFEILSQYGPLLQPICEINIELQSGKEWARTFVAALLPPVVGVGSEHRNKFLWVWCTGSLFLGAACSYFEKIWRSGIKYLEGSHI